MAGLSGYSPVRSVAGRVGAIVLALADIASGFGTGVATALGINTNITGGVTVQTGPTAWTPTDGSGASLTFTNVDCKYTKIGNIVHAYGRLSYPVTADGSNATIAGLPVGVPNQTSAAIPGPIMTTAALSLQSLTINNTSTFEIRSPTTAGNVINSALSNSLIIFDVWYPVA
jgi:hypothetical protein